MLLDTPCTATGTIRRHPEIARLRAPDDLPPLCATQDTLLASALGMLAPGGVLVYVTCSIQPEECAERIESLLAARSDLRRDPVGAGEIAGLAGVISEAGDLRTLPAHEAARGGMDGFYAARLRLRD